MGRLETGRVPSSRELKEKHARVTHLALDALVERLRLYMLEAPGGIELRTFCKQLVFVAGNKWQCSSNHTDTGSQPQRNQLVICIMTYGQTSKPRLR
jgi:hypothetical protein